VDTIHAWFTNSLGAQQEAQNYSIKDWTQSETESGGICGYANYNGIGVAGIKFTVFNENGDIIETGYTDSSGNINFDDLPNGNYAIEIMTPLGFTAYPEASQLVTVNGYPCSAAAFELIPNATGKIHDIWWWKAQFQYIRDKKPSVISMANVNAFCANIYEHFYLRGDEYAIQIENITYAPGPEALDFYDVLNLMVTLASDQSNKASAARNLLANLLNIAAGYQSQLALVSVDGATASQAITYFSELYILGGNTAYYSVHINLRRMNLRQMIPAGIVPLTTPNIMFKQEERVIIPSDYNLSQNYPNPFNPITEISFSLPGACDVTLEIFNISGQKVASLVNGRLDAGNHMIQWDSRENGGASVASGIYLYRLKAGEFTDIKKMMLIK
jgi:hypothetical protein